MAGLRQDIQVAWRSIRRMPLLAAVVAFSLGVGIGVNTVVFSWMQALIWRPLPGVRDAARFQVIETVTDAGARPGTSWLEYLDLRSRVTSLPDLIAFRMAPLNVGEPDRNERAYALFVSGNYFSALGLRPALGRELTDADARPGGGEPVVVVSHAFWRNRLAADPGAIGRTVRVNGRELTIVGVTPDQFQGTVMGLQFDLWVPATLAPVLLPGARELDDRSVRGYMVMGRVRPPATLAHAQADVNGAMRELAEAWPLTNAAVRAELLPFWRATRGPQRMLQQAVAVLQGVMIVLLLAVCGNTANLLLARAIGRRREVGVRLAIGAAPWHIVRLLLVEGLILAVAGAAIGLVLAAWGTNALRAMAVISTAFPVRFQTSVDPAGLAFASALAGLCALVVCAAPALHLARVRPSSALATGREGMLRPATRNVLMASEVALSVIVLLASGLFVRGMAEAADPNPGFVRDGLLLAAYDRSDRGIDAAASRDFTSRLLAQVASLPEVRSAAVASSVPLDIHGLPAQSFTLEGRSRTDGAVDRALSNTVTPRYFETMGIPIVAGADFADLMEPAREPEVIVNEAFVARYLADGEPIGRRIENGGRTYTIAAVVKDSTYDAFGEPPTPCLYFSYRDRPRAQGEIHVRTRAAAEAGIAEPLRRVVRALDATLPLYNVRTLSEHVETNLFLRRVPARMFAVLGPLTLALAIVGVYAVVACAVAERTTEIGVRLALGASRRQVVRQIVTESMLTVTLGALAGWLAVIGVYSHVARGSMSAAVFAGVPTVLLAAAAVACWMPASRVARVDPVVVLRHE
jgi:predicted permease